MLEDTLMRHRGDRSIYLLVKICTNGSRSKGIGYRLFLLALEVVVESP